MRTCPHCHQMIRSAPAALALLVETMSLPRRERLVAETLLNCWPRWVERSYLVARVYEDHGDDFENADITVQSHVSKLKAKLIDHGWTVESKRFTGYRLIELKRDTWPAALPSGLQQQGDSI